MAISKAVQFAIKMAPTTKWHPSEDNHSAFQPAPARKGFATM